MQLRTKVKVGNITNLSDARYCAGMGVDLLGFRIGAHDKQVPLEVFHEIANWVAGPKFVFELADSIDEELFEKVTQLSSIHYVQLNYSQFEKYEKRINKKAVILEMKTTDWASIQKEVAAYSISYLLITDDTISDWNAIKDINNNIPVFIHHESILNDDIDQLPITGIVLEGSEEDKPGQKDYDHLSNVLESLEVVN